MVQISLDLIVGHEVDGMEIADYIAEELNRSGFMVVGAGFQEDVTEYYREHCPELRYRRKTYELLDLL